MSRKKGQLKAGTYIERDLFTSRAFWALKGAAPQLLILFLGKRDMKKDGGKYKAANIRRLTMTYLELENLWTTNKVKRLTESKSSEQKKQGKEADGIERKRIIRAINELMAKGFIEIVHQGGAYQMDKSVYALTEDWRLWRPGLIFRTRIPDTRLRGYRANKQILRAETPPIHTGGNATLNGEENSI